MLHLLYNMKTLPNSVVHIPGGNRLMVEIFYKIYIIQNNRNLFQLSAQFKLIQ